MGEDIELVKGAKKQLTPVFTPSYSVADDIVYSSDNEAIATVSENGIIKAIGEGNVIIRATSDEFGLSDTINVTVRKANTSMHGTIVDTNSHYTQDRYKEVLELGNMKEELYAWKADKAISEIIVASKEGELKNVTVSSSDFISGENVISSENIITTFLKETKAYIGDAGYHASSDGPQNTPNDDNYKVSVPDILYTEDPVDVEFNSLQPIWIEINVPANTDSGVYEGIITVTADGVDNMTFNYLLEVLDATMPNSSDYGFDFEAWQYPYSSAEYYGLKPFSEEHLEILKPHMLKYKELGGHAITASIVEEAWGGQTYSENEIRYPSMIKWIRSADGTFRFDYTDFDKWVKFNKDLGIGDKIVCYSMIPWGNNVKYYDEATQTTKVENLPAGTDRYEEVWLQFLNKLVEHLDEKGWFEDTYIGIDERVNMDKAFDVIDKVKNRHDKVLKKAAAMDHFSTGYKHITDRIDDLSVGSTAAKGSLADYKSFVSDRNNSEKEYKTTIYTCTEHFPNSLALSMPGESYWTMMFTAAQGATGYMRWAFDAWVKDPLIDTTHWAFEAGDTFLIYPDEKDSIDKTSKSSVRLEKIAEGIRDVNKLYMMKNEITSLKDDVDKLLDTVKLNYDGTKNGIGEHGGAKYATDETRAMIPEDMASIKDEIKNITKKYTELKNNGVNIIDSVEINNGDSTIKLGESIELAVTVLPENALNKNVVWTSSNEDVVTVNSKGVTKGIKVGTAKITATSVQDSSKKATINIIVNKGSIEDSARVAYYSFDNIDGNVVKNSWGDGSLYNGKIDGANIIEGKSGKALNFNVGTDNVKIKDPADLQENWTISFWVKRGNEDGTASVMWDGRVATGSSEQNSLSLDLAVGVGVNSAKPGVHVNEGTLSFPTEISKNKWVHMAYTNSKSEGLALYVNGEKVGNNNEYTKNNPMKAPLAFIGGRGFVGEVDEIKVYNRALTAEEVIEAKAVNGLNVDSNYKEVYVNEKVQIIADLISDKVDDKVVFKSKDSNIATVDENGLITGASYGDTVITVSNKDEEFIENVDVRVNKRINYQNTLESYDITSDKQIVIDREEGQYLGQPDTILLDDDKTILTVYPKGHGFGEALLSKSTDGGLTWKRRVLANETWKSSEETPTIYKLNLVDGSQKLISISGGPEWHGSTFRGFKTSISDDNGETWGDYTEWNTGIRTIVAMASLVQLKDEKGNFIDKWMGVFHDYDYVNYKTYLTFDENGNEKWSDPEPYLSEYRELESKYQICEVGMFRSPDGKRIVALARSQSHKHTSTIFYSDDEGKTWSRPREVQGSLNGERHKAVYDPISGRLLISFREIKLDTRQDGNTSDNDWMAGDWIGWVGTYEDLINGRDGEYRIRLGKDYTNSTKAGDCGYAGNVVMSDGTFFLNSYGNFDTNTNNNTYIMGTRFKLGEIDNALGKVTRNELKALLDEVEVLDASKYTEESYDKLMSVYNEARSVYEDITSAQVQIDRLVQRLNSAKNELEEVENLNPSLGFKLEEKVVLGNNFDLVVSTNNLQNGIFAMDFEVEFDGSKVDFVEARVINEYRYIITTKVVDNKVRVLISTKGQEVENDKDIIKLVFKSKDIGENIVFSSQEGKIADGEGKEISIAGATASIIIIDKSIDPDIKVDKTLLKVAISYAEEAISEGLLKDLVPAVVKEFNSALGEAKLVYNNEEAMKVEVEAVANRLINVIWMLEFEAGDKGALKAIIDIAGALIELEYTSDSWDKLQNCLNEAKKVYEDKNALKDDVNKTIDKLQKSIDELVKDNIKRENLKSLINMILELSNKENNYIATTWLNLQSELEKAKVVLVNEKAIQEEIDKAYNNLMRAYLNLRLKPSRDKLEELLNKVELLNEADYTKDSWNKLQKIALKANNVMKYNDASEKDLENIEELLEKAISELVSLKSNKINNNIAENNGSIVDVSSRSNNNKLPKTGEVALGSTTVVGILSVIIGIRLCRRKNKYLKS
nr:glycoside hydrolase domain-containing protein [Clostridium sp. D53t1_180928_C8]